MGTDDKTQNKAEEAYAKGKREAGEATGNEDVANEGRAEESKANLKQAAEKVKDAFKK
ncbi:MAG TPA: CsbD family protein [Nocardioidaceae bacterium]|jgi:uncharacterized protein YjbJ (UPF0337 family)|nr:CsbD family protein [Nocardioidaceae bacterium]